MSLKSERLYFISRIFLGILFIWASYDKILDPKDFADVINNYKILPVGFINPLAVLLPWLEACCGILLISGYFVKGSVLIIDMLLIVFIFAFIYNIYRGLDINCGCFSAEGEGGAGGMYFDLIRDIIFLCIGVWVLWYSIIKRDVRSKSRHA